MGYQLNTDYSGIAPSEGGQRAMFPVSDSKGWLCMLVESEGKENSKKDGRILAMKLQGLEGPVTGKFHEFAINIANPSTEAVRIGQEELSAIGHCVGHIRVGNSSEWHGRPLRVVIALEKDQEKYPGSTRIVGFRDQHGNKPSEAGQGALSNPNASGFQTGQPTGQPAGNFQQQPQQGGGAWQGGGAPTGQPGQFQPNPNPAPTGQPAFDPNAGQNPAAFQGQPQQSFQPQHTVQGQPMQGQNPGGGYTDPNAGAYPTGQFNPNTQGQGQPQQGQPQQNGGFQGGTGQPSWA
jgi:hypothetical protein